MRWFVERGRTGSNPEHYILYLGRNGGNVSCVVVTQEAG